MIDREQEYLKMAATEKHLWWYRILHLIVQRRLKKEQSSKNAAILDAGCGTGGLMTHLIERGYTNLKGIDLSDKAVEICKNKGLAVSKANVDEVQSHFEPNSFEVIISNDVLCYFESADQEKVINGMVSLLKPGGILLMNLPSFQAFRGMHDIGVGIKHRFNNSDFNRFNQFHKIELEHLFYWPFLLSPLIFIIRSLQRISLKANPNQEIKSDVNLPPKALNWLLYAICRFELLFSNWSVIGSSTFLTFKKEANELN